MPQAASPKAPVLLVCGEDDFGVKERAREVFRQWSAEIGGLDHETIDASAGNSGEALAALAKLRAALQTLPFFGSGKASLQLHLFVDKSSVEVFAGWSAEDRDWAQQAEGLALRVLGELDKEISGEALGRLVTYTGPNPRALRSEIEKLSLYCGARARVQTADVEAIVTRQKQARAFALGDALGDRDLPRALRCLDEELWEARRDPQHSEIGVLYGLISKVRSLLLVSEMLRLKWLRAEKDFSRFKGQLARIPAEALPEDKKFNPLAINPYVLFRALGQAPNYTQAELITAMALLLECNRQLVSRSLDPALVMQQALVRIVSRPGGQVLSAAA